jgi:Skp family chaperone for outer membrane proteins
MAQRFLSSTALLLPLSIAFLWIGSEAIGRRATPSPSEASLAGEITIAVVNLEKLLSGTNESAKWDVHLKELTQGLTDQRTAKESELKQIEESIRNEPDEAKKRILLDQGVRTQYLTEEWLRLKESELDRERALRWQAIYRSIREEIQAVADANGIDLVLVNDGMEPDIKAGTNQTKQSQVLGQILSSKVLFASKRIDITDQVITRINNKTK